jgi:hypothetical protein
VFVYFLLQGIRFTGMSILDCQKKLPGVELGGEPLPKGFLRLLTIEEVTMPLVLQFIVGLVDFGAYFKVPDEL